MTSQSESEHISYPTKALEPEDTSQSPSTSSRPQPTLKDCLYIGNLHPTIDEYTLIQIFAKFGKITKLDFLFHKSGPLKGKPRGYAFIAYNSQDDAKSALEHTNGRVFRGRKLVVTFANQTNTDFHNATPSGIARLHEPNRPTTLSLIKTGGIGRRNGKGNPTTDKIAMMEAKLRQMEASSSTSGSLPWAPASLPPKPAAAPTHPSSSDSGPKPLSLPVPPSTYELTVPTPRVTSSARRLTGVKIKKTKEKG